MWVSFEIRAFVYWINIRKTVSGSYRLFSYSYYSCLIFAHFFFGGVCLLMCQILKSFAFEGSSCVDAFIARVTAVRSKCAD